MAKTAKVHAYHFGCEKPKLVLDLGTKDKQVVEFVNFELLTDDEKTAEKVKATKMFKRDFIWDASTQEGYIRLALKQAKGGAPKIITGATGTDSDDEKEALQNELAKAKAKIAELEKAEK